MKPYFVLRLDSKVPLPDGLVILCTVEDHAAAKKFVEDHGEENFKYIFAKWAAGPFVVERAVRKITGESK